MAAKSKTLFPDPPPPQQATKLLLDGSVPDELRLQLMKSLMTSGHPGADEILLGPLQAATAASAKEEYLAKSKELGETLRQMAAGPLRQGAFLRLAEKGPWGRRAEVRLTDRSQAFCVVPEEDLAKSLRRGDLVWLEAAGKAVLFREDRPVEAGEEARFERRIGETCVEVTVHDHERCVLHASEDLVAGIEAGEVPPGSALIVSTALEMAFRALPPEDGLAHHRFLAREPVPDVVAERDIGDPPAAIAVFEEHVRREMEEPELGRLYGLRACLTMVLYGVSGSGKTLTLRACWNLMYRIMSEVTGVAIEDLPYRVVRVRPSMVLSKWFGESDQLVDRLFDEIEQLAATPFVGPDGREHRLPLLVLIEEMDALTRARGNDADGIYDRVQSTLLQRWDVTASRTLRDSPVIFASTTNIVRHVDAAALRRAGAWMERFGHLGRRGFASVLDKHLRDRPVAVDEGMDPEEARRDLVARLTASLYSPNGSDPGQVEILCANEANRIVKHRRDFCTGGLLDRAVQSALGTACREHRAGSPRPGLTARHLEQAFAEQVRNVADQLDRRNVSDYLALPDGLHVTDVRRIPQSSVLPFELERAG
jgi:ATP-dependent 26S proteasome regulatory subunit